MPYSVKMIMGADHERARLIHGDLHEVLPQFVSGDLNAVHVDHMITDPPYGAEVHSQGRVARNRDGHVAVDVIPFAALTKEDRDMISRYAVHRLKGWALIFSQLEQVADWRPAIEGAAAEAERQARYYQTMTWVKPDGRPNFRGNGPAQGTESIQTYWIGGGQSKWNGGGKAGVYTFVKRHTGSHPTEKPLPLMRQLVLDFTNEGDVVIDPFMGSGSTGVACLELGRRFIGIERDPTYYDTAVKRIEEASRKTSLLIKAPSDGALFDTPRFARQGQSRKRKEA